MTLLWRLYCRIFGHHMVKVGEREKRGGLGFVIAIEMCTRCDRRKNVLRVRGER